MTVIACVDENMGMLFNNRRVSRDKAVIRKIVEITGENSLWINHFSEDLFMEIGSCKTDSEFLNRAAEDDFCFVENLPLQPYEKYIDKIILFNWNRKYPSDAKFDIPLGRWKLSESSDFKGHSHEKITMEVYTK